MKVTVVGAGAVGATCADNIARAALAEELVLLDIKEGLAEGKAQDMMQTAALLGFDTRITLAGVIQRPCGDAPRLAQWIVQRGDGMREFFIVVWHHVRSSRSRRHCHGNRSGRPIGDQRD